MSAGFRALVVVLVMAGLVASGYLWGDHARDNAWLAKEAQRVQAEKDAIELEIRRGEKASGELQAQLLQQDIRNEELERAFDDYKRRNPILARRPVGPAAAAPAGPTQAGHCDPVPAGDDPALSLGAVWMWNSALAGRDEPAGACGLADASPQACAADSGISLTDAWDNQALNARLCAEDRVRHQSLIDFLNGKKP